jgi:predicted dinucleotide-binding enzyme
VNIGTIGADRIGETLTRKLAQLGHRVAAANSRRPERRKRFVGRSENDR